MIQKITPLAKPKSPGTEVPRTEFTKLKLLDLFSGIGSFSLGLERSLAFETVAFCEIDPFRRKVLRKHWPHVPQYDDVRTLTANRLAADGITPNAMCGGFPCTDISHAGRQRGIGSETRSGLYSEIIRLAGELRPDILIMENVTALFSGPSERPGWWLGRILGDLAEIRYDTEWHGIRAGTLGLPQERDRVWIVAYPNEIGRQAPILETPLANKAGSFREWEQVEFYGTRSGNTRWLPVARNWRVANGTPTQLDIDRTGAIGDTVAWMIPELIGRAIMESVR